MAILQKVPLKYIILFAQRRLISMAGISNWFVVLMGIGTVFIGLICIIILCKILGVLCSALVKDEPKAEINAAPQAENAGLPMPENKQEILAAACAVIAEELGTSVEALKVVSFKRV